MPESSELKDELAVLGQHIQTFVIEDRRPWVEFFGPVSQPLWTQVEVRKRVSINLSFFKTNYIMICAMCSAVYILRSPGLLLTLLVSVCLFLYVFMSRRKPLVLLEMSLGTREKTIAAGAISTLLLSVTGYIFSLQYSGILGGTICALHALFRPPVARAIQNARGGGEPELHGGDGDLEGGGSGERGRAAPVNANMRLRTRPAAGVAMGMSAPMAGISGGGYNVPPGFQSTTTPGLHSHLT